jgi:Nuclease-related domain
MADAFPTWIQNLAPGDLRLLIGLLVLAALLTLSYLLRKPLRYWRETRQIARAARRMGARLLRGITLPDGMGGQITIDYLALSTDAILVIGVKRYDGMIFGSVQTDEWTQTLNSRSYKFPNPDTYLAQQVTAVRSIVPKTPVRGLHLFTDSAAFPWDKPSNVLQSRDLRSSGARRPRLKDIPRELRMAWTHIMQSIK